MLEISSCCLELFTRNLYPISSTFRARFGILFGYQLLLSKEAQACGYNQTTAYLWAHLHDRYNKHTGTSDLQPAETRAARKTETRVPPIYFFRHRWATYGALQGPRTRFPRSARDRYTRPPHYSEQNFPFDHTITRVNVTRTSPRHVAPHTIRLPAPCAYIIYNTYI